ncbi:MAG TPA: tetratricopeptide repeat protein [Casimicrobiaceae bacterium]
MTTAFEIGPFRLEPDANLLMRDGIAAPLGSRAVGVLRTLVEHANEFVPKSQIIADVWHEAVVEEGNLPVQIAAIRRVLEQGGGSHWIETLPRRGYRFVGPVAEVAERHPLAESDRRSNLPLALTAFIGREREVADVERLLPTCRLLTLVGVGGIGKTRLALHVGAAHVDAYRDGVWFVDLASLADAALVASAVAQSLGIRDSSVRESLVDVLGHSLEQRRLLLILDNCEHVLSACASLAQALLQRTDALTIMATSREPLQIGAEQRYLVQSLSLPDPTADANAMANSDAVSLFVQRAQRHQAGFALTPARAGIVAQICIHLDGIPLALELAAARIHSLSLEQIHARLDNRFRLLTDGGRTALPRQQTLRATFDWSFDLLAEDERAVLRRLSVFAGGFTLEAATAVACHATSDENAVIDLLRQLTLRSLVIADTSGARARYRLLETTRAYALEKLAESGEAEAVKHQHAEYFRRCFEPAFDDWQRLSDADWHALYSVELDNVRAALAWALSPRGDAHVGIQLAASSRPLWTPLPLREGKQWLRAAIDRIDASTPPSDQARLWAALGTLSHTAEPAEGQAALTRAVELYRQTGDERGLGRALLGLGRLWVFMGRFDDAATVLAEAFPMLERDDAPKTLARYFETFAFLKMLSGDLTSARTHFEKALALYRSAGAEWSVAIVLNLADMTWADGDLDAALARFNEAVALIRESPNMPRDILGFGLTNLAGVYIERGELDRALAVAREGLPLRRESDFEGALDHLALRLALVGKREDAARLAAFIDHAWKVKDAKRQPNEARARGRLETLLRKHLAPAELHDLFVEGAKLGVDHAYRLALEEGADRPAHCT